MKTRGLAWLVLLLAAVPAGAQKRYVLRVPAGAIERVASRHGLAVLHRTEAAGQVLALVADHAGRPERELVDKARLEPDVAGIEPDAALKVPEAPGAPALNQSTVAILDALADRSVTTYYGGPAWTGYSGQAAVRITRLRDAQALASGQGPVAVIDTGVDPAHPLLRNVLVSGYDFTREQPGIPSELADLDQSTVAILDGIGSPLAGGTAAAVNQSTVAILDQSTVAILDRAALPAAFGHGTMVAGLVHLVAPSARIMPVKAFRADGTGSLYDVVRAVYFAVEAGARVINMSFSMEEYSPELQAAIAFANSRRVVCVASAGNAGRNVVVFPAGLRKVEGVASTDNRDGRSAFSNYGDAITVAAPGEGLITAYPGGTYAAASGTSFSTALVAGGAALVEQIDPNTNQAQTVAALSEAEPAGPGLGAGRIDFFRACLYASRH